MRMIAWCVLTLSLVGCHSGPRWCLRDSDTSGPAQFDNQPAIESAPQPAAPPPAQPSKEGQKPTVLQPTQKERTPYESSSRTRPLLRGRQTSRASKSKSTSRTTQTARRSAAPAATTKAAVQDNSVKQLQADLEKTKREKAELETKLSEESAKQTQQRLELEARLALIQEQMRQQSVLQQAAYQQQSATSRPRPSYAGPTITSGSPSPSLQMPPSSSAPQSQGIPASDNSVPACNIPSVPQQQVEQWPYSPQHR